MHGCSRPLSTGYTVENDPPIKAGNGYRAARIGVAIGLSCVVGLLLVLDALSPDYDVSYVTLTALLATILTLLGIEVAASLFGRGK